MQSKIIIARMFMFFIAVLSLALSAHFTVGSSNEDQETELSTCVFETTAIHITAQSPHDIDLEIEQPPRYEVAASSYEVDLLARTIYHEARGESMEGQYAVAEVVMNRVVSSLYPNTIEEVIYDYNGKFYQFSCAPYLESAPITEQDAFQKATQIAYEVTGQYEGSVIPDDYLYFSTQHPTGSNYLKIGNHYFW